MEKPTVDLERRYTLGKLAQNCTQCSWKDEKLGIEIEGCPVCGGRISKDCSISFGGTSIEYREHKNRFFINGGIIYEADYTDAMVFFLKHSTFWMDQVDFAKKMALFEVEQKKKREVENLKNEVKALTDRTTIHTAMIREIARMACKKVTKRVIAKCQKIQDTLSDADSSLENTWDEICVQVQREQSFYWDAYDEIVHNIVESEVQELQEFERQAIFLQTDDCDDIIENFEEGCDKCPDGIEEIVDHIKHEYIYQKARAWSNDRIRKHLDNSW